MRRMQQEMSFVKESVQRIEDEVQEVNATLRDLLEWQLEREE